jgi:hypothetical protein
MKRYATPIQRRKAIVRKRTRRGKRSRYSAKLHRKKFAALVARFGKEKVS